MECSSLCSKQHYAMQSTFPFTLSKFGLAKQRIGGS
uniref:Uncharacterized protein n=1 Tax=Anguilla anguilla TaxID=7936 RepID=A0A0E9TZG6_ANGAN